MEDDPTKPGSKNFDWDAWEAIRSIEGKTDKLTTEGFSYYSVYKSGLLPGVNEYNKEDGNARNILSINMTVGNIEGEDLEAQAKDLEEILRQKIDGKTVDEVMKYVRQKRIVRMSFQKKHLMKRIIADTELLVVKKVKRRWESSEK